MNRARLSLLALAPLLACAHTPAAPTIEAAPPQPAPAASAPATTPTPAPSTARPTAPRTAVPARAAQSPSPRRPSAPPAAPAAATHPEPAGPAEYFPLAVGNEWIYVDQSPSLPATERGVQRTVRILERTADGFFRDSERGEFRVDGSCVRDRKRRLLCEPFQKGASWSSVVSVSSTEQYEIVATDETVEVPAGRFEHCVRVRAHNRSGRSIDQVAEHSYAPRVGLVRIETYVIVDGKVTPQVKAVLQRYRVEGR